jgi:hypothetical protein
MATSWLMVLTAIMGPASMTATISDGAYRSMDACTRTGENSVLALNQTELELESKHTKVYTNGDKVIAYRARAWSFQCLPTEKEWGGRLRRSRSCKAANQLKTNA